jgi:hypothetical protein
VKSNETIRIEKIIAAGILPENLEELSELQQEIYDDVMTSPLYPTELIEKYINYANLLTKQKYIFRKIKQKKYDKRSHVMVCPNLRPEDIIINEFCPFFETKIDYRTSKENLKITTHMYSIDRIDNSKMYMKGNVWVISRFANVIKSDATLGELKTFSKNVIKQILHKKGMLL